MRKRLWFAYFSILLCWNVAAYGELGRQWCTKTLLLSGPPENPVIMDFLYHYSVTRLARESIQTKTSIYDPAAQLRVTNEDLAPVKVERPNYAPYPPSFFLVMLPFVFLPKEIAWLCWAALTLALVTSAAIVIVAREYESLFPRIFFLLFVFACQPMWFTIRDGNLAAWLFPGLALFWFSLADSKYFRAGLASSVAMIKVQYLPIVFLVGTVLGTKRFLTSFALCALVFLINSVLLFGLNNVLTWPHAVELGDTEGMIGVYPHMFNNIRAFLYLQAGGELPMQKQLCRILLVAISGLITVVWYILNRKQNWNRTNLPLVGDARSNFLVLGSITILLSLISSLHTYTQDYCVASLACIWLWTWSNSSACLLSKLKKGFLQTLILSFPVASWIYPSFKDLFTYVIKLPPLATWSVILIALAAEGLYRYSIANPQPVSQPALKQA